MKNKIKSPLVYTINMNKPQALRIGGYMVLLIFLGGSLFTAIAGKPDGLPFNPAIAMVVYLATIALHELIHGLFFKVYGGKPKFGVGLMYYVMPYAYATAHGQPYTFRQMLVIGMSPFVLICAAAIAVALNEPGLTQYASVAFVGNFAGAVGDMWLMRQVARFRRLNNLMFVDLKNGIAVHGKGPQAKALVATMRKLDDSESKGAKLSIIAVKSLAVLLGVTLLIPIVLNTLSFTGHILIGPQAFPLFEMNTSDKAQSVQLNFIPLILASVLFAVVYTAIAGGKRKPLS